MELLPLHKHEGLMQDCIDILNKEWPRSNGARLHSLKKSCDHLPVALVFVETSKNDVVGFSKISEVQGHKNSCLLESVIIREKDRGKGYGRNLMEMTEQHAVGLEIKTAYLNTTDKVGFYSRLGYVKCNPVVSLGANAHRVPDSMLKHFVQSTEQKDEGLCNGMKKLKVVTKSNPNQSNVGYKNSVQKDSTSSSAANLSTSSLQSQPPPPPPPPPPKHPSPFPQSASIVPLDASKVTWMKKEL